MQILTLVEVKAAARDAHREKRLTAQHPDKNQRRCVYHIPGSFFRCAIGAALNSSTIESLPKNTEPSSEYPVQGGSVSNIQGKYVKITGGDLHSVIAIQDAHDEWAIGGREGTSDGLLKEREQDFLDLIYS